MNTKQQGMVLLESLMAVLVFSLGILSIVALLSVSVKNSSSAQYRTEASLLANQVIGQMEIGQRNFATLTADYGPDGAKFVAWRESVASTLPGVTGDNLPTIEIAADQTATITLRWQAPGDNTVHNFVAIAKIVG